MFTDTNKRLAIEQLFKQGPMFVLLLVVFAGLYQIGAYTVDTAIPAHLKSIQTGYKSMQDQNTIDIDRMLQSCETREKAHDVAMQDALIEMKLGAREMQSAGRDLRDAARNLNPKSE